MHALVEHPHGQRARCHAAQRCRQPELIVIAAAGIEADHQRRAADARRQMIDVIGQIVAAGFLARLDQDDAARMRHALLAAAPVSAVSAPNIA